MRDRVLDHRGVWVVLGLVAGLAVTAFWPHEQAYAVATDRDAQFAITTLNVGVIDPIEGVFVLDFLTGSLRGAVLNRQVGKFTAFYERDLAIDFGLDPKSEPRFAIVSGQAALASRGGPVMASSVIYIGELTSGRIICYGFPWQETTRPVKLTLAPIDTFQFRERSQ